MMKNNKKTTKCRCGSLATGQLDRGSYGLDGGIVRCCAECRRDLHEEYREESTAAAKLRDLYADTQLGVECPACGAGFGERCHGRIPSGGVCNERWQDFVLARSSGRSK